MKQEHKDLVERYRVLKPSKLIAKAFYKIQLGYDTSLNTKVPCFCSGSHRESYIKDFLVWYENYITLNDSNPTE
jgi:hypothetical protein